MWLWLWIWVWPLSEISNMFQLMFFSRPTRWTFLPNIYHISTLQYVRLLMNVHVISLQTWRLFSSVNRCTCNEGYTGQNCENEYIPCDPSPCKNGGQCRSRDKHSYTCECPTGKWGWWNFLRVYSSSGISARIGIGALLNLIKISRLINPL